MEKIHLTFDEMLTSLIHRNLRRFPNFRFYDPMIEPDLVSAIPSLTNGEEIKGIYLNNPDQITSSFIITNKGFHIFDTQWRLIEYGQMNKADILKGENFDKTTADTMVITLNSGETITIPILGGKGRLRDIWVVSRFVSRVIYAYKKRQT